MLGRSVLGLCVWLVGFVGRPLCLRAYDNAGCLQFEENDRPRVTRDPHNNEIQKAAVVFLRNPLREVVVCAKTANLLPTNA